MLNVRKIARNYEESARSYAELAPFMAQIAPDMVINKDGSLLVCYSMVGVDQEGLPGTEVDRYANLVEHAFRGFNERFTIWSTVDRRRINEYPESAFSNPVSAWVDQHWKYQFQTQGQFQNFLHLCVLYTPPNGVEGYFEKVGHFVKNEGISPAKALGKALVTTFSTQRTFVFEANQLQSFIDDFQEKLSTFEQTVLDVDLRRLQDENLLGYLHRRCSPTSYQQKVKVPNIPAYLDSYLPGDQLVSRGDTLRFRGAEGDKHIAAMSLKDWPDWTHPGILDDLLAIPGEITISQVFRFSDNLKAKAFIEGVEKHNRSMQKTLFTYIKEALTKEESQQVNHGRVLLAEDASDALTEMTSHNRAYGHYNLTVVTYGDTAIEAETVLRMVNQVLQRRGYMTVRETMHLLSAFVGTIPGQWGELVRWHFVSTANVSDLAPVRTLGVGQKTNDYFKDQRGDGVDQPALTVMSTEHNTPYFFNFHQADLAHAICIGPSRTGKSSLMNFLISQFQKYEPCSTIIFDKDYSCRIPTVMQGGDHVDMGLGAESNVKLNPMRLLGNPNSRVWLTNWLEMLFTAKGYKMRSTDLDGLSKALERLAAQPQGMWRLQSLAPFLPKELKEELHPWISSGAYAKYFDNAEDTFVLGDKTCIEMGGLFANPTIATLFIEYAFYCILQRLDGKPTLIYIEEAWFMLANERFAAGIDNWLRTLGKLNAFLIMSTQSVQEVANSSIFATIIDNIPNRIFLPNQSAMAHVDMYRNLFQLNDEQINRIRNAMPKRNYYIVTPKLSRMVDVSFPKEIRAVVRSDKRAQKVFEQHWRSGEQEWRNNYLKEILHA